jgi:hypothetical protein
LHDTDFETFEYDTSSSKHSLNISRLFKDDDLADKSLISGALKEAGQPHPDCLQRYLAVLSNPEVKHEGHGN